MTITVPQPRDQEQPGRLYRVLKEQYHINWRQASGLTGPTQLLSCGLYFRDESEWVEKVKFAYSLLLAAFPSWLRENLRDLCP